MSIKQIEKSGLQAIKNLRERKLKNGQPFMINSNSLPSGQCYMEYPNGSIALVSLCRKSSDFKVITEYSAKQVNLIRKKYQLT
jgi:hypothetical protein